MSPQPDVSNNITSELWDDNMLFQSSDEDQFSEVMNEDFLLIDDGIEDDFENEDDFSGLLDINPSSAFESTEDKLRKVKVTEPETSPGKRSDDEFESPRPPKRTKFLSDGVGSPTSVAYLTSFTSRPSFTSQSSIFSLSSETCPPQDKYKLALQHLALSMRRSEMTRNEIIRVRRENETKARLLAAQSNTVNTFLTGNTATLTVGLDQSRKMLQAFMGKGKTMPFL